MRVAVVARNRACAGRVLIGLLYPLYTITGFDASAHTSEETIDAQNTVPKGMLTRCSGPSSSVSRWRSAWFSLCPPSIQRWLPTQPDDGVERDHGPTRRHSRWADACRHGHPRLEFLLGALQRADHAELPWEAVCHRHHPRQLLLRAVWPDLDLAHDLRLRA